MDPRGAGELEKVVQRLQSKGVSATAKPVSAKVSQYSSYTISKKLSKHMKLLHDQPTLAEQKNPMIMKNPDTVRKQYTKWTPEAHKGTRKGGAAIAK